MAELPPDTGAAMTVSGGRPSEGGLRRKAELYDLAAEAFSTGDYECLAARSPSRTERGGG